MSRQVLLCLALLLLCAQLSIAFRTLPSSPLLHCTTRRHLFGSPGPKNTPPPKKDAGGGLFGGMGNLMESMKKAQEIAKQAEALNKELGEMIITNKDSTEQVSVTFNGLGVPVAIQFADSILTQGADVVSAAASQALREGHEKAQANMMAKMQALYSSAGIPLPPQK